MFHDGDLTSGISLAIAQSKVVAILVRTPQRSDATQAYDSRIWEEYWLQNLDTAWDELNGPPFGELVREKAVLLRIDMGSQEAGFLNHFCPIAVAPTLAIIKDGQVLDKIEQGVSREEFVYRTSKAVGLKVEGPSPATLSTPTANTAEDSTQILTSQHQQSHPDAPAIPSNDKSADIEGESSQSATVRQVLRERSQKLEADKAAQEAAAKAERVERAKARRKEAEDAAATTSTSAPTSDSKSAPAKSDSNNARKDWLQQQHQRKQEAKLERERILKQIENDKQNRKARLRPQDDISPSSDDKLLRTSGAAATASSLRLSTNECSLQVRLFDGSSIRSRFSTEATLANEVRRWVANSTSENREQADNPYNFRHVLPPRPSRTIEASEEHKSLRDLGLLPTATLVLSPVHGATDAYANAGSGLFGKAYNMGTAIFGYVGQIVPNLFGTNSGNSSNPRPNGIDNNDGIGATPAPKPAASTTRVQTISNPPDDRPSEFYNGNSLGFEGRDDRTNDEPR